MSPARADRARELAQRYPAAKEAIELYAAVSEFTGDWRELQALVQRIGPALLREAARRLTPEIIAAEPEGFFARVLRRAHPPAVRHAETSRCPKCGSWPQAACLRPQGDGSAFYLVCSLCSNEWRHPRGFCPSCGEHDANKIVYFAAEGMEHVQMQVCESCARYLHVINLGKDPRAIPDLDEVAALTMDVWAREQGWEKVYPNLIGI